MSAALLTDLYQLTMAHGYWRHGLAERPAIFHLYFRRAPFGSAFAVACGLAPAMEHLARLRFEPEDLDYLASLVGNDGKPLLAPEFLAYLGRLEPRCEVAAVPEGRVVFAGEPLLRVTGPLALCQILETPLLTLINFQTLIATKAARVCRAAQGRPVLDFGLRRAQGPDGGLGASRAAYVGGVAGTSNVEAGRRWGIPVGGTHAHSWIMAFEEEEEAFRAYARAMPNNCIFLVDTYDTLEGVERAVAVARRLRRDGHEMVGVRLDSGDIGPLSREVRRRLDAAGFPEAKIVASNDLDEHRIAALLAEGAAIDLWGVGTRLVTAHDQPALGGVYKLAALDDGSGRWLPKIKLSDEPAKISNPGAQQVRRFRSATGELLADVIHDDHRPLPEPCRWIDGRGGKHRAAAGTAGEDLLVPVLARGEPLRPPEPLERCRERLRADLAGLRPEHLALADPTPYPVGLEEGLARRKDGMIADLRGEGAAAGSDRRVARTDG